MSTKIGRLLVDEGLITPQQLEHALRAQLMFGGRLGSCLVELGYTDETSLVRTLAEIFHARPASPDYFEHIPKSVQNALSVELVRKHRIVPFRIEQRALHVAMMDPGGVPNLSLTTGLKIVPYIATEARIQSAMERYYGIPSERRRRLKLSEPRESPVATPSTPAGARSRAQRPAPSAAERQPAPGWTHPLLDLRDTLRRITRAADHTAMPEAVVDYLAHRARRALFFDVNGEQARVCAWRGDDLGPWVNDRLVSLSADSIFTLMVDEACFRGTVSQEPAYARFRSTLGLGPAHEILLLPLYGEDQLEAVIYADGGADGSIEGSTESLLLLAETLTLTLRLLAARKSIGPRRDSRRAP